MRSIATADDALLTNMGGRTTFVRVDVKDSGGTFRDLTTYPIANLVESVTWGEGVDDPGMTARITLKREVELLSISPTMQASALNKAFNPAGSFAPLIDLKREVKIYTWDAPDGVPVANAVWRLAFHGKIDHIDWGGPANVELMCADLQGDARDAFIEDERIYAHASPADPDATKGCLVFELNRAYALNDLVVPTEAKRNGHFYKVTTAGTTSSSVEPTWNTSGGGTTASGSVVFTEVGVTTTVTGTLVETCMQQILNDNMAAPPTLTAPVSPAWAVRWWLQARISSWDAVRALANQIGWDLRFWYNSGSDAFRLELRDPGRSKSTPDRTFAASDKISVNRIELNIGEIRNVVKGWYLDSQDLDESKQPKRKSRLVSDSASITKYGRRFCEIGEASTSNIDSSTELDTFVNAVLSDLKDPVAEKEVVMPFFFAAELHDLYRFSSDGVYHDINLDLAVVHYEHTINGTQATTTLKCRGKPIAGKDRWLKQETRSKGDSHRAQSNSSSSIAQIASPTIGGAHLRVDANYSKQQLSNGWEMHLSGSSGFTPDNSTMISSGEIQGTLKADLYPGQTYYLKSTPMGRNARRIVRGLPSEETSFVAGFLEPRHLNPQMFRAEMPPNGSFEDIARGSGFPPSRWEMQTGTWNTDIELGPVKHPGIVSPIDGTRDLEWKSTSVATAIRSELFPVNANHMHELAFWIYRASMGNSVDCQIEWFDYTKATISTNTFNFAASSLIDSKWNFRSKSWVAPSTAAFARVILKKASANTDTFYMDAVQVIDRGDKWHHIGDTDEPAFANSWVNFDGSNKPRAGFRRASGLIWLGGWVKSGTIGSSMFTLPVAPDRPVRLIAAGHPISRVRAKRTTAQTISTATETRIQFATEDWDALGEHDTSTTVGRFTALYGGYYKISCGVLYTSVAWTASNVVELYIKKNGTREFVSRVCAQANFTNYFGTHLEGTVKLAAGDNITIETYHDRGANTDLHNDGTYNFICVDRLNEVAIIEVGTDGSVTALSGDNTLVCLDGLCFPEITE